MAVLCGWLGILGKITTNSRTAIFVCAQELERYRAAEINTVRGRLTRGRSLAAICSAGHITCDISLVKWSDG